jgi:hypothetical protein
MLRLLEAENVSLAKNSQIVPESDLEHRPLAGQGTLSKPAAGLEGRRAA